MRTLLFVFALGGLLSQPAAAKVNVVTTLPDFAAIAAELGGDRVEAESLIRGTQDPHYVDAKPSFVLKASRADLLVVIGLGLEDGWLPVLLTQARNGDIQPGGRGYLDASQVVRVKEVPINPDRSMGDVHGGGNPHYYTSPQELLRIARAIHAKLVELDPEGKPAFDERWQAFQATMADPRAVMRQYLVDEVDPGEQTVAVGGESLAAGLAELDQLLRRNSTRAEEKLRQLQAHLNHPETQATLRDLEQALVQFRFREAEQHLATIRGSLEGEKL